MKTLLALIITLLTGCPSTQTFDVTVLGGAAPKTYGPAANDLERCNLLRQALSEMKANESMVLNAGTFDCDGKNKGTVFFPSDIIVTGKSKEETKLYSNVWSDAQGSAFEIKNGTFSNLTFENQSWQINEDGRTLEFYWGWKRTPDGKDYLKVNNAKVLGEPASVYTVNLNNVGLVGNAWVVYDWSDKGHTWNIDGAKIVSGRQGVSMMAGGNGMQHLNIKNSVINIDTSLSQDVGDTSNRVYGGGYGIVVRGGTANIDNVTIMMKCGPNIEPASFVPRCVGIYDGGDFGSASNPNTYIKITNTRFSIFGNGSKDVYDVFIINPSVREKLSQSGNFGDGPDSGITKNW